MVVDDAITDVRQFCCDAYKRIKEQLDITLYEENEKKEGEKKYMFHEFLLDMFHKFCHADDFFKRMK